MKSKSNRRKYKSASDQFHRTMESERFAAPTVKTIDHWETHLTHLPERTCDTARLVNFGYRGDYVYEKNDGYDHYRFRTWQRVKALQRRSGPRGGWRTWMVDDPTHMHGMKRLVDHMPAGGVLCAGLGLGLMVHHCLARPDITRVTVVEIDRNVIKLIRPTLPRDKRLTIINADFYEFIEHDPIAQAHNSILWDLGVGTPAETRGDFLVCLALCDLYLPKIDSTNLFQFGVHGRNLFTKWDGTQS